MPGKVIIAGAGPGDEGLVTLSCLKALESSDVVIYDRLIPVGILRYARGDAELIYAGKEPGRHVMEEDEVIGLIIKRAREGKVVLRLHGGDPFLFGRGFEEYMAIVKEGIPCEVIPGVASALAVPEAYLVPPVLRGVASSVAIVTGTEDPGKGRRFVDFRKLATAVDTVIILMGTGRIREIAEELVQGGRDAETPVAIITRAYMENSSIIITNLGEIINGKVTAKNPSVIVIGEVVKKGEEAMRITNPRSSTQGSRGTRY